MTASDACPKCGFSRLPYATECLQCGIVYERWQKRHVITPTPATEEQPRETANPFHWLDEGETPPLAPPEPPERPERPVPPMDPEWSQESTPVQEWKQPATHRAQPEEILRRSPLAHYLSRRDGGLVADHSGPQASDYGNRSLWISVFIGALLYAFPLTRFLMGYLVILVHEMGHAVIHWSFGQVAIPSFDFVYGGGVTRGFPRNYLLLMVIVGLLSYPFYQNRNVPGIRRNWLILMAVYAVILFSPLHELFIVAGGHFFELAWATLCLYRSVTGRDLRSALERPLYAVIGSFTFIHALAFSSKLMMSVAYQYEYSMAKPGMAMDLDRIAHEFFHVKTSLVAAIFVLATLAVIPCVLVLRKDEVRQRLMGKLLHFAGYGDRH